MEHHARVTTNTGHVNQPIGGRMDFKSLLKKGGPSCVEEPRVPLPLVGPLDFKCA